MRNSLKWMVGGLLALTLPACVTADHTKAFKIEERHVRTTISAALSDIEDYYYRETRASELVAIGLSHIAAAHQQIHFAQESYEIAVYAGDYPVYRFAMGHDQGESDYWAYEVASSLGKISRTHTGAGIEDLMDVFLEGIFESLHARAEYTPIWRTMSDWNSRGEGDGDIDLALEPHPSGWAVNRVRNIPLRDAGLLQPNDVILEIDGRPVATTSLKVTNDLLRGEAGSTVTLRLLRPDNEEPMSVVVKRPPWIAGPLSSTKKDR